MASHDNGLNGDGEELTPLNPREDKDESPLTVWKSLTNEEKKEQLINFIVTKKIKQRKYARKKEDADSFGEIEFVGFGQNTNRIAPYVRLDEHTDIKIVWELLVDLWRIPRPKTVICVIGGHQDLFIEERLKKLLSEGLYKAANKPGTWIVTEGTSSGVTKFVGDVIRERSQGTKDNEVVILGVTTWNVLLNNEALKNSPSNEGLWPAKYDERDLHPEKFRYKFKPTILDCNHSHFILLDYGKPFFGLDIAFRTDLLRYIAKHGGTNNSTDGNTDAQVPAVLVVIEGSYNTIKSVYQTLVQNSMDKGAKGDAAGIPVVIIKGSGRAADIIAEAYLRSRNTEMSDDRIVADQEKNVRDLIAHVKNGRWRNTLMEECLNHLKQIIAPQNRRLITIFQKDDSNFVEIVNALWQESKNDSLDTTEKLKLATVLNRYGTIEDFIEKEDRIQEPEKSNKMDGIFSELLINNKADFVDLFLVNIVNINEYLTYERLSKLYREVLQMDVEDPLHMFKKELKREKSEKWLDGIGSLLRKLTGDEYNALYKEFKGRPQEAYVSDPNKHLFLWAVLLNRRKLAILFLKRLTTGSIGTALIASRILRELSVYAKRKNKLTLHSDVLQLSGEFKDVALGTLERLYEADSKNCELAVVRTLPAFGKTTCLSTAYSSNNRKFMGHDCCQSKLQSVWNGNLSISSRAQWIAFFVGIILPIFPVMMLLNDYPEESSGSGKIERFFISVRNYYTAPITKFVYNFVSYIVLLLLFAFFILTDLRPYGEANSPGTIEWIIVVWVTTMAVEEVRQLIARAPKSMKYKAISWISDVWNMLDFAMYLLFAVSFLLRLILPPNVFVAARVMYCMTYIIFCLRPLQFGFVLKEVGPKTIMIFKMMKDLAYFLFILILFLVGFGVAVEAILYPNMDPHFNLIARALYKPFWYLYGELFLEEIEGRIDNVTCYEDPRFMNVCPQVGEYQWVVHGLTAIYLLISNILLINLLIAMFSFTFGKVQENAELIWKFHRYALIFEYVDRPTLAPPLIIIEHVFRLIKDLKMRLTEKCLKEEKEEEQQQQQQYLNQLEKRHLNDYFIERDQQQIKSAERRVKSIDERVDKAVLEVCEIKSSISKLRLELKDEIDIMKKDILYEISKIKTKE